MGSIVEFSSDKFRRLLEGFSKSDSSTGLLIRLYPTVLLTLGAASKRRRASPMTKRRGKVGANQHDSLNVLASKSCKYV